MDDLEMNKVIEIDVKKCVRALKKSLNLIILVTLISLLFGIFAGLFLIDQRDRYKATATVFAKSYFSEDTNVSMENLVGLFESRGVSERAAEILGNDNFTAEDVSKMVKCSYDSSPTKASTLKISAYSVNNQRAEKVANAAANAFVLEIADLYGKDILTISETADNQSIIYYKVSSQRLKVIISITVLGCFLVCAFIVLREILSPRMYTAKDATAYGTLNIIGVIPDFKK